MGFIKWYQVNVLMLVQMYGVHNIHAGNIQNYKKLSPKMISILKKIHKKKMYYYHYFFENIKKRFITQSKQKKMKQNLETPSFLHRTHKYNSMMGRLHENP